ncbi:MAG: hypothetical protein LC775_07170, partial [Acidobacteria bacterium]|nr:hypothetical protein [Acidobacteriota bacterium]
TAPAPPVTPTRNLPGLRAADPAGVGPETRGVVVAGLAFVRPYRSQRHLSSGLRGPPFRTLWARSL